MRSERRVVFLGTGDFAVPALEALVRDGYQVRAVYTQPDRPAGRGRTSRLSAVKRAAERLGLPVQQPETLRGAEAIGALRALEPDVLVLAAYGLLLPRGFLAVPPRGGLNIHPSLLPRHRGPSPVTGALLEGDEETGVTIFLMDAGMDTGPILARRSTGVHPGETAGALTERLAQIGAELVREVLPRWLTGEVEPVPQREEAASYSRLLKKEDGELDWRRPAVVLERQVRAFQPWPGSHTRWRGRLLKVLEATQVSRDAVARSPGEVFVRDGQLAVATGEGALLLKRLQLEGKRAMTSEELLRGYRDLVGSLLPS